jgi:hypothetical protein
MESLDYWKVFGIAVLTVAVFWLFSLISKKCFSFDFSVDNIAVTFIGIVAAFVVVGNYAQVKDIERKFDEKINDLKVVFKNETESVNRELRKSSYKKDLEGNIAALFQFVSLMSQEKQEDAIINALSYCTHDIRKIKEADQAERIHIPDYSLSNFIKMIEINIEKGVIRKASIANVERLLDDLENIEGVSEDEKVKLKIAHRKIRAIYNYRKEHEH